MTGQGRRFVNYWRLCPNDKPMRDAVGMDKATFELLLRELKDTAGLIDSADVKADKKLAMTIWVMRGSDSIRRTAMAFQRALSTVSL